MHLAPNNRFGDDFRVGKITRHFLTDRPVTEAEILALQPPLADSQFPMFYAKTVAVDGLAVTITFSPPPNSVIQDVDGKWLDPWRPYLAIRPIGDRIIGEFRPCRGGE